MVEKKIYDNFKLQLLLRNTKTDWKKIGIELKLSELIGNLKQKDFESQLNAVLEKLYETIEEISIRKLQPRKDFIKNSLRPQTRIVNFHSDECFHGSLECLGVLKQIKKVSINFNPGYLQRDYEIRFIKVAVSDIENLEKALEKFAKLECFKIYCDLSETAKIQHLLQPMKFMSNLETLNFSFCGISSQNSAEEFKELLRVNQNLKSLELKGNHLDDGFCEVFAQGLEEFNGNLQFLGLSKTPILGNGLQHIIKAIRIRNNVNHLEISCCQNLEFKNNNDCLQEISDMIESGGTLRIIEMNTNNIESPEIREKIIKALDKNYVLDELQCEDSS